MDTKLIYKLLDSTKNTHLKEKIINRFRSNVILNSCKMTETEIRDYVSTINSYKPYLIRGYASSLYDLCRYAERKNLTIYSPKILVSTAETLTSEMRHIRISEIQKKIIYNTKSG